MAVPLGHGKAINQALVDESKWDPVALLQCFPQSFAHLTMVRPIMILMGTLNLGIHEEDGH